ncbi:MAG TPA: hypothetical protein VGO31_14040 [Microbacteriaceae bacterium]|jgi:hypothetical protein|nr:hypothetical protein [Microbacteriaceae bacterium]
MSDQKPGVQKPPAPAEHGGDQPLNRPLDTSTATAIPLTPPEPDSPPI